MRIRSPIARRWLCRLGIVLGGLLALCTVVGVVGWLRPIAGEKQTPAGFRRNLAQYVTVHDGTKLAVEVWLPADLAPGQRLPVAFRATRYFRALEPGPLLRIRQGLGLAPNPGRGVADLNAAGFALVIVDVRGTGASFGSRRGELSSLEIDDLVEVLDWLVKQSWCNGRVGLFGISYDGTAAELLAARNHPAVRSVALAFSPWDIYEQPFRPGGLLNLGMLETWGGMIRRMDEGTLAEGIGARGWQRWFLPLQWRGPKPVDDDQGRVLLARARASHSTANPMVRARDVTCRDDGSTDGLDLQAMSPMEHRESLARIRIPTFVLAGWLDGNNAAGALERFQAMHGPQILVIGPWTHGGDVEVDPLSTSRKSLAPSPKAQWDEILDFMRFHLQEAGQPPQTGVRYITLGSGVWNHSVGWPPEGLTTRRWFFSANNRLDQAAPMTDSGADDYSVDFEVAGGANTRWNAINPSINYSNRALVDRRLLTFTISELSDDLEVTGAPLLRLYLSSTATDGAFHAYLEDVAPDDKVTYITEGTLRAIHRASKLDRPGLDLSVGLHSFLRADASPMAPGEVTRLEIELLPTSVRFQKGHRLRVSLAGADAGHFERVPPSNSVRWRVYRDQTHSSQIELPVRASAPHASARPAVRARTTNYC